MMISANLKNSINENKVTICSGNSSKSLSIPAKEQGMGSAVNGGELLFLSICTCFCNDIYREAAKKNMKIQSVDVTVTGEFEKENEPCLSIAYKADIYAPDHSNKEIKDLIEYVDSIAEIHNTIRNGASLILKME